MNPEELPECEGDLDLIIAIGDHGERFFGPVDLVYDEIRSSFVHVDIYRFKPDPLSNLVTFVTSGMAQKPMNVPGHVREPDNYRYAELVLQMPAPLVAEFGSHTSWPIQTMNRLARMPHKDETWLWSGHTIGAENPEPFRNTNLSVATIWPGMLLPDEFRTLEMADGRSIDFLTLGFIDQDERIFSRENYQEGLFEEILRRKRNPEEFLIFDPYRPSLFAPKKPWWKRR